MKLFARLLDDLLNTNTSGEKLSMLVKYLNRADDRDKLWMVWLLSGRRIRKHLSLSQIKAWAAESAGIPDWLFEDSYSFVGYLAETITLLHHSPQLSDADKSLDEYACLIQSLNIEEGDSSKNKLIAVWKSLEKTELFVFNKMLTGKLRSGISESMIVSAIAESDSLHPHLVAYRLSGKWDPESVTYYELVRKPRNDDESCIPYPYCVTGNLEKLETIEADPAQWKAEWKWDGIRAQVIKRKGNIHIWKKGEEIVTAKFPELQSAFDSMDNGTVLDGEIICSRNGKPLGFSHLQNRLRRSKATYKVIEEAPVAFVAFDILEHGHKDVRNLKLSERRQLLEQVLDGFETDGAIALSEQLEFENSEDLCRLRELSRSNGTEGLMLKWKDSIYHAGKEKLDWWKLKSDPLTIDAVLVYAQADQVRRDETFADYTFAVWNEGTLVTIAKANSGLSNNEIEEVDRFVRDNTLERFGPVRTVRPELVFQLAFEGISQSPRHKSGIALRSPSIVRFRKDKKANEADELNSLKKLILR